MPDEFSSEEGPENLESPPSFFPIEPSEEFREPVDMGEPVQVSIQGVYVVEEEGQKSRFVLLQRGRKRLPIVIGGPEAQAISLPLEGARPDRPMTHDLIKSIIERLDADVDRIVIDDLWNGIYYAKIYVTHEEEEELEIDARPSDALAMAVRFDAPIFVAEGILNAVGDEGGT